MARDVIELLESYISADDPKKWARLSSTVQSRGLELMLLKEILIELRALNSANRKAIPGS
jgi:hypothetical protein